MIKIICVGKIKEKFFQEAIQEYLKRISKYTKLEIIEVADSGSENSSINMQKEKELILKHIREKDYVITIEINGKEYDSIEFSKHLEKMVMKNSNLVFVIGGSDGLDLEVKRRSNESLSFSKFTFPHQLFRIILLEQLYRAYKIKNNESYHK